jgi:molybdenum cofactor biosynthesis protein B
LVVVSDTRTAADDETTPLVRALVEAAGHALVATEIVPNRDAAIEEALERAVALAEVRCVVFSGGTGLSPRDRTVDAIEPRFERPIPGFGELFRSLSYPEIAAAALLSRACAGVVSGRAVFLLPGSPDGVRLGLERLVLPEIAHLVAHVERRV